MNRYIRGISALLAVMLAFSSTSCGRDNEDIDDSQESSDESEIEYAETIELTVAVAEYDNIVIDKLDSIGEKSGLNINIIDYTQGSLHEGNDPFDEFKLDLVSGNVPDVVIAAPDDMKKLIDGGYLTDLYPVMDQADSLKRDDFLPNIIDGLETDGKLPAVCSGFRIETAAAKTENVGEDKENWTPEEALEAYYSMPEYTDFLNYGMKYYDIENYFMHRVSRDAIDFSANTCDFGGAFYDMIESVKSFPEYEYYGEDGSALINDKALVSEISIMGITQSLSWQIYGEFGGADVTYVGYPSDSGKGYCTISGVMFGVMESSAEKNAAWEYISLFLTGNYLNAVLIPITESAFDSCLNTSSWNNASVNAPVNFGASDESSSISEEALNKAVNYIKNVEFEPYFSDDLNIIIKEEYKACFAGGKSSQECVDILENRVSIYLSENN